MKLANLHIIRLHNIYSLAFKMSPIKFYHKHLYTQLQNKLNIGDKSITKYFELMQYNAAL